MMDNYLNKENDSNQVRLVELANEYVVELPIQQKIQDAIFELKKKRFDKRIGRWVISKEEKDKFSRTLKPITRVSVSKVSNKKYTNPEIELIIKSHDDSFAVEISNFGDLPQMCLNLIEEFRKLPTRQYDFETKIWSFDYTDKDLFTKTIHDFSKSKSINVKYNDFMP